MQPVYWHRTLSNRGLRVYLGDDFSCTKNERFKVTTYQKEFPGGRENGIDWELLSCISTESNFNIAFVFKYGQSRFTGCYSFFVPLFLKFRGVGIQLPPGSHCASKETCHFSDVFVKSCWYFQFLTHYFLFVVISTTFSSGTFQVIILLKLLKNCKIISIIKPYFHHSKLYNNPPFVYRPFPEKGGPHKYQHPWAEYQGGYSLFASVFFSPQFCMLA